MYPFKLPHKISNVLGEELTFEAIEVENGEKKMLLSNRIQPGCGPVFHVHFKQDESLTVKKGLLGYQLLGKEEKFIEEGETILFKRNVMHRFWNAGEEVLECTGWVKPANSLDYFLTALYDSINKAGKAEGDPFDGAFLITRYKEEYDVAVIPKVCKKSDYADYCSGR